MERRKMDSIWSVRKIMNAKVFYEEFYKLTSQIGLPTVLSGFSLYIDKLADDFRQLGDEGGVDKDACEKVIENLRKLENQVDACINTAMETEFKE